MMETHAATLPAPADEEAGALQPYLFRISRALAGRLDFRSAINSVAQDIRCFLPYDHLDICLLRHDGRLSAAYETGIDTAWGRIEGSVESSPIRDLLTGAVDHFLTGDATNDLRFQHSDTFCAPIREHGLRSRVHVPLVVSDGIIGALSISRTMADAYGARDVISARFVADLISPYMFALREAERSRHAAIVEAEARAREEGLRQGALNLTEALEKERQRIGMDLHDQVLADLSRLMRELSQPGGVDSETVRARLDHSVAELRRVIDEAVPTILEMFGFAHALRVHMERAAVSGEAIDLRGDDEAVIDRLDPVVRIALFRIAQEAINNACRHAGARRVELRIIAGARLRMIIADDGRGMPAEIRRAAHNGGLSHMRTRAQLIGARLSMRSGPSGTSVSVVMPMPAHLRNRPAP
ncbi:MAG: sensor histidine kinase [Paracoccus sp. (in: a-proteobacteria)]|nr:sensor histidine kinase [Paracoccus sp. (in: a-proteobacteria)]